MKITRSFILLLVLIMVSGASFSMDVPEDHWAKSRIDDVVKKSIMTTDANGNFEPNRLTTKIEALVVIYRSAVVGGLVVKEDRDAIDSDLEAKLVSMGIPRVISDYGDDVYPAIAFALDKNIVLLEEVDTLIRNNQPTVLKKVEFAIFLAKALNHYKNENLNKIVILQYKDEVEIELASRKYLMFLIEEGILSSTGDSFGNFNPDSEVTRMIMATMIDRFHDAIGPFMPQPLETEETNTKPIIESEKTIAGIIQNVNDDDKTITVKESTGTIITIDIKSAIISHLGFDVGFDALIQNVSANITIKNGVATSVELDQVYNSFEGTLVSISEVVSNKSEFYSIKVKLQTGSTESKWVYKDTLVTINGISARPSDLKPDYKLIVRFDGYDVKRITAYSEVYEFNAIVDEVIQDSRIRLRKEYGVTFDVDYKAGFTTGDIVKVTLLYGEISSIENIGKANSFTGIIKEIDIKAQPELTVRVEDDVYQRHPISRGVVISDESGNESLDIYDLRLDQRVTVSTGVGGIVRIDTIRRIVVEETAKLFTVMQVFESSSVLIAKDTEGNSRTIVFALESGLSILDYNQGDAIYVEGQTLTDEIFEASKITVTDQ